MAITEKDITKQNFKAFYDQIKPYLNGVLPTMGFTPVGTVISMMSTTAPKNYLVCDGTTYNIADYPELSNHFLSEFGSKNFFGGDGTTTFAVPDLRGEFLRGTGTNSHDGNGDGAAVGTHQDATQIPNVYVSYTTKAMSGYALNDSANHGCANTDSLVTNNGKGFNTGAGTQFDSQSSRTVRYSARPTNTSVLYCIATKNIYVDARYDYSTDEKVVGKWIDGKPLYQKIVSGQLVASGDIASCTISTPSNIDNMVYLYTMCINSSASVPYPNANNSDKLRTVYFYKSQSLIYVQSKNAADASGNIYCTIQYTKITD